MLIARVPGVLGVVREHTQAKKHLEGPVPAYGPSQSCPRHPQKHGQKLKKKKKKTVRGSTLISR